MTSRWDRVRFHGRYNAYPFTEVVSFVLGTFGSLDEEKRAATRILDLGCGGGHHLRFLAEQGFDYFGVDGSAESVDIARQMLADTGHDNSQVLQADLDDLPYDGDFFDAVIDRGSLTCNRRSDLPGLYAEVRRVLRPGGYFFSMMLHVDATAHEGARSLGDGDFDQLPGRLEQAGLLHFTSTEEQLELLSGLFTVQSIETDRRTVEYGEPSTTAWSITTCRK